MALITKAAQVLFALTAIHNFLHFATMVLPSLVGGYAVNGLVRAVKSSGRFAKIWAGVKYRGGAGRQGACCGGIYIRLAAIGIYFFGRISFHTLIR